MSGHQDKPAITLLLDRAAEGDTDSTAKVWQEMYQEIHRIAAGFAAREGATPSIQASMLINEAYLRIFGGKVPRWNDRQHFLNTVAKSMGHFLVDHARNRASLKRGGGRAKVGLTIAVGELADYKTATSIDGIEAIQAIEALEHESPDAAEVAWLRFVLGLNVDQTAAAVGLAPRTVKKKWAFAKAWLRHRLSQSQGM